MPLVSLVKYYASDTDDAAVQFASIITSAGWELYDTFGTPTEYVFKSRGLNNEEMAVYCHMYRNTADTLNFMMYAGWNAGTHIGTYYVGNVSYCRLNCDDNGPFYIWCCASEDSFVACAFFTGETDVVMIGRYIPQYEPCRGRLAVAATAGSSVTLTLSAGDADDFFEREFRIFNAENRELCNVTSVIPSANQIIVDSLIYNYDVGDVISTNPHRWFYWMSDYSYIYLFNQDTNGTGNDLGNTGWQDIVTTTSADPDTSNGLYTMWPWQMRDNSNAGNAGFPHNSWLWRRMIINATNENTVSVRDYDTGTTTSAAAKSLTDSSKSWTVNQYADKVLIITAGTGNGQFRKIVSNTSDTLTIKKAFTTPLDGTSTYTICEEGWLFIYANNAAAQAGVMRII